MPLKDIVVNMMWDSEASVWVATSDDVPGLVLESPSFDKLITKVRAAIPELLILNGSRFIPRVNYKSERMETVPVNG